MARFTNQAQLTYHNRITNSNVAVSEILEVLSAAKHAVNSNYEPYKVLTYVISLVNSSSSALNELTVTDDLGSYSFENTTLVPLQYLPDTLKYYVNGTLQATPTITSQNPLTIEGISIPPLGNALII